MAHADYFRRPTRLPWQVEDEAPPELDLGPYQPPLGDYLSRTPTPRAPERPQAEYVEPKLGKGRLIGGILASLFSPGLGNYILSQPYERAERAYRGQLAGQQDYDRQAALGREQVRDWIAGGKAGSEMEENRTQADYFRRRAEQPSEFQEKVGLFKSDPETYRGVFPDRSTDDREFFQTDPEGFGQYLDVREKAGARYRQPQQPSDFQQKLDLFKSDPETYRGMFGDAGAKLDEQTTSRLWRIALQSATVLGEVDFDKATANYEELVAQEVQRRGQSATAAAQPGAQAEIKVGTVIVNDAGVEYRWDGKQWQPNQ